MSLKTRFPPIHLHFNIHIRCLSGKQKRNHLRNIAVIILRNRSYTQNSSDVCGICALTRIFWSYIYFKKCPFVIISRKNLFDFSVFKTLCIRRKYWNRKKPTTTIKLIRIISTPTTNNITPR